MDHFFWLDRDRLPNPILVGDKAFYLSYLAQRGYPVAPGLVVSARVLREFWEHHPWTNPLLAELSNSSLHVDINNARQLQAIATQIRQEIVDAELPSEWVETLKEAIARWDAPAYQFRPSLALPSGTDAPASHDIGNLLDAYVARNTPESLALALKQVWAELYRARCLFYWPQTGIALDRLHLAVLVQPLARAIASGTMDARGAELDLKSTWGLGIALALGTVVPDRYRIHLPTGKIQQQQLGNKICTYDLTQTPATETGDSPIQGIQELPFNILEAEKQQQFSLSETYLRSAIGLGQEAKTELGECFHLEWTLWEVEGKTSPKFSLTEAYPVDCTDESPPEISISTPKTEAIETDSTPHFPLVGMAASGGRAIAPAYPIPDLSEVSDRERVGCILVAAAIDPDWLPLLKQAAGIITEQGGLAAHGAILARELGIPAVVGVTNAMTLISAGERILVDGDRGEVRRPEAKERDRVANAPEMEANAVADRSPLGTQLLVNLSQPSAIASIAELPVDGVGLVRSELMALDILAGQTPQQWLQASGDPQAIARFSEVIEQFAHAFAPRPVYYRSLDWRVSRQPASDSALANASAVLGLHGTFSYRLDPQWFELELAAIARVRQSGYDNLHLLLPFVRSVDEFEFCRDRVEAVGLLAQRSFQLWIMAEVPSVLLLLPDYVEAGVSGISIGSNDLTQLLLSADRESQTMSATFDERHPAVMRAIAQLIATAQQCGIPCSICGDAPTRYPEIIDRLVEWGITSISVNPMAIERTYQAIARAERRLLLNLARDRLRSD